MCSSGILGDSSSAPILLQGLQAPPGMVFLGAGVRMKSPQCHISCSWSTSRDGDSTSSPGFNKGDFQFYFSLVLTRIPLPTDNLSSFKRSGLKFSSPASGVGGEEGSLSCSELCWISTQRLLGLLYKMRSGGEESHGLSAVTPEPAQDPTELSAPSHTWFYPRHLELCSSNHISALQGSDFPSQVPLLSSDLSSSAG